MAGYVRLLIHTPSQNSKAAHDFLSLNAHTLYIGTVQRSTCGSWLQVSCAGRQLFTTMPWSSTGGSTTTKSSSSSSWLVECSPRSRISWQSRGVAEDRINKYHLSMTSQSQCAMGFAVWIHMTFYVTQRTFFMTTKRRKKNKKKTLQIQKMHSLKG